MQMFGNNYPKDLSLFGRACLWVARSNEAQNGLG